ncbi:hypothetical protein QQ020_24870 [Fulvivirgaceae bacterium BMA12]|uniref:Uncharacterized protein n=1 Tax=Agaribacillus aureus TaxID=3051825 RepID=A0ABT8LE36_9BACT|nr:hypothetical protein [Fulvivirgaceae bacterium BMA12]
MLEAIEKFEDILRRLKKLNYGDHNLFSATRKECLMLINNFLPKDSPYKKDLEQIKISKNNQENDSSSLDRWIHGHEEFINLVRIVIEDLQIQQRKEINKSKNKTEIEKYVSEIERIKNDTGKDLIFERNNYNYLKRKYDLLQYNYDQLNASYQQVLGKKNQWILYITWTVLVGLLVLVFDQIIHWQWFEDHSRRLYIKLTGLLFTGSIFLLIPFRKNIRIMVVSGIVLLVLVILVLLPYA